MARSELGIAVRTARIAAGLTREQLAVKAGLAAATVVRVEKGSHGARVDTLEAIATALGVPVSDLLAAAPEKAAS